MEVREAFSLCDDKEFIDLLYVMCAVNVRCQPVSSPGLLEHSPGNTESVLENFFFIRNHSLLPLLLKPPPIRQFTSTEYNLARHRFM